jgi:hypothetical protein
MLNFLKRLWRGIKNLFKKEPIVAAATVVSVPAILYTAPKLAVSLGSSHPVLFTITISIILLPTLGRMIWNHS